MVADAARAGRDSKKPRQMAADAVMTREEAKE